MKDSISGVILAGGLNSRFSGKNKGMIEVQGRRILDRIYEIFGQLFKEIVIVTNEPIRYLEWDALITTDIFPIRSSLTGIHAGLFSISKPYMFVTACDAPFLKKELIETLIERTTDSGIDVIVPETSQGLEPLCAVYAKNCLPVIENKLRNQQFKIKDMFRRLKVKKVSEKILRQSDPELISFLNINTPEDLAKIENSAVE